MPDVPRSIRVFVSSTFRDMEAERDELAKFVFPALHRLCEDRGVGFTDVDLRWGITEESAAAKGVLPICLAEIEGCRPYFIGILGERYGWVPDDVPDELIRRQPWLAEHREKSITELEVVHGVLNSPEMAERCFFYFRDSAYVESVPVESRSDFVCEDAASQVKLDALKARIRASGLPLCEGYSNPQELGRLVEGHLRDVIEASYPIEGIPDPLQQERIAHEAYARSRRALYIGRSSHLERLDAHATSDDPPLVVTGDSGSGKSALVANWAERFRGSTPHVPVVEHYVGASATSADWVSMCRRVAAEMSGATGVAFSFGDTDDAGEIRARFKEGLHKIGARMRAVLVIDGLNQLEDRAGALDLPWLPNKMPAGMRVVLTTLPGSPLNEAHRRAWPEFVVEPLAASEREQLITRYLEDYSKELTEPQLRRIADSPQSSNPLFLRTLLGELRTWGRMETLDQAVADYLAAGTPDGLLQKVLARWELDYERDRPSLVRDTMVALWAARRGIDETELLEILGVPAQPLPRAHFSPLFLAAEPILANRSGLLGFAHDFLRMAVESRYLSTEAEQKAAHALLADYFLAADQSQPRVIEELPWQMQRAERWRDLAELVADLEVLQAVRKVNADDELRYWAALKDAGVSPVETYAETLADPGRVPTKSLDRLATLLRSLGHPREAEHLRAHIVGRLREDGDSKELQSAINKLANLRKALGDREGALAGYAEAEDICRRTGNDVGLQAALNNRALILRGRGHLDQAMELLRETESICRRLGRNSSLESSLYNQASILRQTGNIEAALRLLDEAERLARESVSPSRLRNVLSARASIARMRGDLSGALRLQDERLRSSRELGSMSGAESALNDAALSHMDREEYALAGDLLEEAMAICDELKLDAPKRAVLGSQVRLAHLAGESSVARALAVQWEAMCGKRRASAPRF